MKKLIFIAIALFSQTAFSAIYERTGKIAVIRSHTAFWGSDSWIQLEGVNGNSGCIDGPESGTGLLTYMVIPSAEKSLYSMALAAYMAGKTVNVNFTSDTLSNSLCTVKYITIIR